MQAPPAAQHLQLGSCQGKQLQSTVVDSTRWLNNFIICLFNQVVEPSIGPSKVLANAEWSSFSQFLQLSWLSISTSPRSGHGVGFQPGFQQASEGRRSDHRIRGASSLRNLAIKNHRWLWWLWWLLMVSSADWPGDPVFRTFFNDHLSYLWLNWWCMNSWICSY